MKSILAILKMDQSRTEEACRSRSCCLAPSQSLWVKTSIMTLCEEKEGGMIKSKEEQKKVM